MPSRASKRTKRTTKAQSTKAQSKTKDQREVENSPTPSFGGEVLPVEENASSTRSVAPSTPPTEYTNVSAPSKKRKHDCQDVDSDYEAVGILKGDPHVRDLTELPLIAKNSTGEPKILWAKMDTGADINVTTEKLVAKLGFTHLIQPVAPTSDTLEIREIGGKSIVIDRKVTLSFTAGRNNILCKDIDFWIPRQDNDTDEDGIPDVLLGLPALNKFHMIMVDPDFCNEPKEGLEVLAKKAKDEAEKPVILLGSKYPQIKVRGK
jgi:hypothetical protein